MCRGRCVMHASYATVAGQVSAMTGTLLLHCAVEHQAGERHDDELVMCRDVNLRPAEGNPMGSPCGGLPFTL